MGSVASDSGWTTLTALAVRRAASQPAGRIDPARPGRLGSNKRRTRPATPPTAPAVRERFSVLRETSLDRSARVLASRLIYDSRGQDSDCAHCVDRHRLRGVKSTKPAPQGVAVEPTGFVMTRPGATLVPLDIGHRRSRWRGSSPEAERPLPGLLEE